MVKENAYFFLNSEIWLSKHKWYTPLCKLRVSIVLPNPFFTTDVVASVQNYVLVQDSSKTPSAYITSVAADKITVFSESSFRYAVSISRTW